MLSLQHIRKSFDGIPVLKDITLDIREGKILFHEEDITRQPMEKRGFNIVFQDYALFPNLNVYQNIVYGLRNKPGISTQEEVKGLIRLLGLEEPLSALDGVIKESIKEQNRRIAREYRLTSCSLI